MKHESVGKKYNVIYADPPWYFRVWSNKGMSRSAENNYSTVMFKYWSAGPNEPNQFSLEYLKQQHQQFSCTIAANKIIDKTTAYEILKVTAAQS